MEKYAGMKRTAWGDFLAFMHGEHPDIENLIDVRTENPHTEEQYRHAVDGGAGCFSDPNLLG